MLELPLPALLALLLVAYGAARVIYNLYFHPLARFPGPKLAAATAWYETYYDLLAAPGDGGRYAYTIDHMHTRYGPIVRINPHELHVNDPAFYDVIKVAGGHKRDKYPPRSRSSNTPTGTFGTLLHDPHRRRKAVTVSPFFARRHIADSQALLRAKAESLWGLFRAAGARGEPLQLDLTFLAYSLEVVCQLVLGIEEDLLGDPARAQFWHTAFNSVFELTPFVANFPQVADFMQTLPVRVLDWINPYFAGMMRFNDRIEKHAAGIKKQYEDLEAAAPKGEARAKSIETLFHAILSSDLPPAEKSLTRLTHEGREIIVAGAETAARTMASAVYFVLSTPGVLATLRAELGDLCATPGVYPDLGTLEKLPYLTAVIKETLRTRFILFGRMPLCAPDQTLQYGEWTIPRNTPVAVTERLVLLDPIAFPEPHTFRPERWLVDDTSLMDKRFVAFGRGARSCSGTNLAWAELYIVLSTLFARFDMELYDLDYDRDIKFTRDILMSSVSRNSPGIRVKVTRTDL